MSIINNRIIRSGGNHHDNVVGLILMGAVSCGKKTQMKKLLNDEDYEGVHIDLGEEIRQKLISDPHFSRQHEHLVSSGRLLPDPVVLNLVAEKARQIRQKGIIGLDGFCRNRCQADMIGHIFTRPDNLLAVEFEVDFDIVMQRAPSRGRSDDNMAQSRYKLWQDNRNGVFRKLSAKGVKVVSVNANGTPDFVFEQFHQHVRNHVLHLKSLSDQKQRSGSSSRVLTHPHSGPWEDSEHHH